MHFIQYSDVCEFHKDTYNVLMQHEAQNMILLGNVLTGVKGEDKTGWRDPVNWVMATVSDENGIVLTALMTPPHNMTLYATKNEINLKAINCLIAGLSEYDIPGVITEKNLAEKFAEAYTLDKNLTFSTAMNQRIYELTSVSPDVKQIGTLRLFEEKDMHYLPYWVEAFSAANTYGNMKMFIPQNLNEYLYRVASKKLYVLEIDGSPVSMAGLSREMQTAVGVSFVYTPPYFCGKGYATSCVAQLSQLALDKGFTRCVLYTDLSNPTSNSIYQKIGYQAICDSLMLSFE